MITPTAVKEKYNHRKADSTCCKDCKYYNLKRNLCGGFKISEGLKPFNSGLYDTCDNFKYWKK